MLDRTQLMKGILEGCILKTISLGETYGYEIVTRLEGYGFTHVKEGTIYPILIRLESKKLLTSVYKSSPLGPKRKYFTLTGEGKLALESFNIVWNEIATIVKKLMEE